MTQYTTRYIAVNIEKKLRGSMYLSAQYTSQQKSKTQEIFTSSLRYIVRRIIGLTIGTAYKKNIPFPKEITYVFKEQTDVVRFYAKLLIDLAHDISTKEIYKKIMGSQTNNPTKVVDVFLQFYTLMTGEQLQSSDIGEDVNKLLRAAFAGKDGQFSQSTSGKGGAEKASMCDSIRQAESLQTNDRNGSVGISHGLSGNLSEAMVFDQTSKGAIHRFMNNDNEIICHGIAVDADKGLSQNTNLTQSFIDYIYVAIVSPQFRIQLDTHFKEDTIFTKSMENIQKVVSTHNTSISTSTSTYNIIKRFQNYYVNVASEWKTQIRLKQKSLLEIQYKYIHDDPGDIQVTTTFAGRELPVTSKVLSASDAASTKNIYEALFKTWGDLNLYMYAASLEFDQGVRATAKTGDVSAGALWCDLTVNVQANRASMRTQNSGAADVQPQFALELTQTRFLASHVLGNKNRELSTVGACRPPISKRSWQNMPELTNINSLVQAAVRDTNVSAITSLNDLVGQYNAAINKEDNIKKNKILKKILEEAPGLAMSFINYIEEPQQANIASPNNNGTTVNDKVRPRRPQPPLPSVTAAPIKSNNGSVLTLVSGEGAGRTKGPQYSSATVSADGSVTGSMNKNAYPEVQSSAVVVAAVANQIQRLNTAAQNKSISATTLKTGVDSALNKLSPEVVFQLNSRAAGLKPRLNNSKKRRAEAINPGKPTKHQRVLNQSQGESTQGNSSTATRTQRRPGTAPREEV